MKKRLIILLFFFFCTSSVVTGEPIIHVPLFLHDPIYEEGSRFFNHSATVEEMPNGDLAAVWFSGLSEGTTDNIVLFSKSFDGGISWTEPVMIFNFGEPIQSRDPLIFFYQDRLRILFTRIIGPGNGPSAGSSDLFYSSSEDGGETWDDPLLIDVGKERTYSPHQKPIQLDDGSLAVGIYWRDLNNRQTHAGILVISSDFQQWEVRGDIYIENLNKLIEPSLLSTEDNELFLYFRASGDKIYFSSSIDEGETWSYPLPLPVPNPNSLVDTKYLPNGKVLLAWNNSPDSRDYLSLGIFSDPFLSVLEKYLIIDRKPGGGQGGRGGQVSYPHILMMEDSIALVYSFLELNTPYGTEKNRYGDIWFVKYRIDDIKPRAGILDSYYYQQPDLNAITDLTFFKNKGIAIGKNGTLLYREKNDNSWVPQISGTNYNLWDIEKTSNQIFIVGEGATMLTSLDEGISWTYSSIGTSIETKLYGIDFLDEFTGLIVGGLIEARGEIFRTVDSGLSWEEINIDNLELNTNLRKVKFVNSRKVFAIGARGTVLESNDAGISWEYRKDIAISNDLWDISFPDKNTGYIVGDKGTFLYTTDGGTYWGKIDLGVDENFRSIYVLHNKRVFLSTDQGSIFWTKNHKLYRWYYDNTANLNAFYSLYPFRNRFHVAGWNGRIFKYNFDNFFGHSPHKKHKKHKKEH